MQLKSGISLLVLWTSLVLAGCQCGSTQERREPQDAREVQERQIQQQREFLEKERESIETYIKDRELEMQRTGTGLYYLVVKDSAFGEPATSGDVVRIDFTISLLNGQEIYSSRESGPRTLRVDKEEAEIGLHEALKQLGVGDEGLFILPSHLAFGVGGDQNKVPPVTALAYEIKMLQLEKSKP
jgi:FKBP-type peptidyl-prolyl cis-trans isomerase